MKGRSIGSFRRATIGYRSYQATSWGLKPVIRGHYGSCVGLAPLCSDAYGWRVSEPESPWHAARRASISASGCAAWETGPQNAELVKSFAAKSGFFIFQFALVPRPDRITYCANCVRRVRMYRKAEGPLPVGTCRDERNSQGPFRGIGSTWVV